MDSIETMYGNNGLAIFPGDNLKNVPKYFRNALQKHIVNVFHDASAYFSQWADEVPSLLMQKYLRTLVAENRWSLHLYGTPYDTQKIGSVSDVTVYFAWDSDTVSSALFEINPRLTDPRAPKILTQAFQRVQRINYGGYCFPGDLFAPIPVLMQRGWPSDYKPTIPDDEVEQTFAWGSWQIDTLVATPTGQANWWWHDVMPIGTLQDGLDWAFRCLINNTFPTSDRWFKECQEKGSG